MPNLNQFLNQPGYGISPTFSFLPGAKLGDIISRFFEVAIFLAGFLAFFWLVWGAFQYIFAGGNKENLAKARGRITWAIVGLILTILAFLVAQFAQQILQPRGGSPIL